MENQIVVRFMAFVLLIGLSLTECQAQDIRNSNWGDSLQQVKLSETLSDWIDGESNEGLPYIAGSTTIAGLGVMIAFYFVDNQLFAVQYIFSESHQNKNIYLNDFDKIHEILNQKYGSKKEEKIWTNDLYKDDTSDYGTAISLGHYSIYTVRENEKTDITHSLTGDNFIIRHGVAYKSKQLSEKAKMRTKNKNLKDF